MGTPSPKASKARIKFENPPINELVIALHHLPILELRAQHIGLYWNRIRDRYPSCTQQIPIVAPDDQQQPTAMIEAPGDVFPLPRFWFFSELHQTLIQVQRNAFMLNWRRSLTDGPGDYPHYERVVEDFWKELDEYKSFLEGSGLGKLDLIQRCEVTYVNLIGSAQGFTTLDRLGSVLPLVTSLYGAQTDGRTLVGLNATATYRLNPTLVIDLSTRTGKRVDTQEAIAVLELKAHGAPSDLSLEAARAWYESAHDAIYQLFLDAADKHVQQEIWKPR